MNKVLKIFYPVLAVCSVLYFIYNRFKSEEDERDQINKLYREYGQEAVDIYHRIMGD